MRPYKNTSGHSGVISYEITEDGIIVRFTDAIYSYTYSSAGKKNVERMKRLAESGEGLSTFISREVKERFEEKISV